MQHLLIPVLALLFSGLMQDARAETPNDINVLQRIAKMSASDASSSAEFVALLQGETLKKVDSIARSREYPQWFSATNPRIVAVVKETIESEVAKAERDSSGDAIFELAVSVVSGAVAEKAMAEAIGAPPPAAFHSKQATKPRALTDGKVKVKGGGALRADLSASSLTNDRGGIGSGNGVLDPGEMAQLSLVFENASKKRLMSTSVYPASSSECVWVMAQPEKEFQLQEMEPGESSTIELNVFFSGRCESPEGWFQLAAYDSQRFAEEPIRFRYAFPAGARSSAGAANRSALLEERLDVDDYGHSEPTKRQPLQPDARVELLAGLVTGADNDGDLQSVLQTFIVPKPLTATHTRSSVRLAPSSDGHSVAAPANGDDVDISVPEKKALLKGLTAHAKRLEWDAATDARLFVAVDSLLSASERLELEEPKSADDSGDDGTAAKFDMKAVEKALAEHLTVTPVLTNDEKSDDLHLLTVHGFRVSVEDPAVLMGALSDAEEGDAPAKATKPASPLQAVSSNDAISYQVRHYIELPVYWERPPATPTCSLQVQDNVGTGSPINVSIKVQNTPEDALGWLQIDGQAFEQANLTQLANGATTMDKRVSTSKAGVRSFRFELRDGEEVLCSATDESRVSDPLVVRKWSLEMGRMTHQAGSTSLCAEDFITATEQNRYCDMKGGSLAGSYGLGDRHNHRLAFGMEYTSNIYGGQNALAALTPWAGYRHTFLVPAEAGTPLYIEISPQLALAAPVYAGLTEGSVIALRPSLRVALHGLIGPYAELGRIVVPGSYGMTSSNFLNIGLGLYWPKN